MKVVIGIAVLPLFGCSSIPDCRDPSSISDLPLNERPVLALQCGVLRAEPYAMLELGERYEHGTGVPVDKARALRLYRRAATPVVKRESVYMPPTNGARYGKVIAIASAEQGEGLPDAQLAYARLVLKWSKNDNQLATSCRYLRSAALRGAGWSRNVTLDRLEGSTIAGGLRWVGRINRSRSS